MPSSEQKVIETAQNLFTEVVKAMSQSPESVFVDFEQDLGSVRVRINCSPVDSRILVGTGAAHIKQLAALARLLFYGSGKIVQILPIESAGYAPSIKKKYGKFEPKDDWCEDYITGLLVRLADAIFYNVTARVVSEPDTTWSQNMRLELWGKIPEEPMKRMAHALSVLFLPIGAKFGRMVYVKVQQVGGQDDC